MCSAFGTRILDKILREAPDVLKEQNRASSSLRTRAYCLLIIAEILILLFRGSPVGGN